MTLLDAFRAYERACVRGASRRDRNLRLNAILGAIEAGDCEAFMIGRIYAKMGEPEGPVEIHRKRQEKVGNVRRFELLTAWPKRARPAKRRSHNSQPSRSSSQKKRAGK